MNNNYNDMHKGYKNSWNLKHDILREIGNAFGALQRQISFRSTSQSQHQKCFISEMGYACIEIGTSYTPLLVLFASICFRASNNYP